MSAENLLKKKLEKNLEQISVKKITRKFRNIDVEQEKKKIKLQSNDEDFARWVKIVLMRDFWPEFVSKGVDLCPIRVAGKRGKINP